MTKRKNHPYLVTLPTHNRDHILVSVEAKTPSGAFHKACRKALDSKDITRKPRFHQANIRTLVEPNSGRPGPVIIATGDPTMLSGKFDTHGSFPKEEPVVIHEDIFGKLVRIQARKALKKDKRTNAERRLNHSKRGPFDGNGHGTHLS